MKKTTLLKSMLLLCALIVGSTCAWATDVTFTAGTEQGTNGSSGNPDTMNKSGITISGTSFATTTTEYRIYSGSTMTISSSVGNITKIVITSTAKKGATKYGPELLTASGYTTEDNSYDGTWTGSATSIEFSASAQCRASKIVVTYEAPTKVATPTFDPAAGAVASGTEVTISCGTDGATIYYTTDGNAPTKSSTVYNSASKPTITAATTIKAYAVKDGLTDSEIASASYTIALPCATPTFSEPEGEVDKGTTVTITCATDGATIYYTTDGTTPTTSSSEYSSALTINTNQTIKAIAAKDGNANSAVASATYTVRDYATLPFNWDGGTSSALAAEQGVTTYGLGSDYADGHAPYRIKMDGAGDYIQIKTNAQPGKVCIGVKMIGGDTTSKIKVQESSDGSEFTDVEELEISGSQYDVLVLATTKAFNKSSRYVRIIKSVHASGGNIGVGPISVFMGISDAADYTPTAMNDVNVTLNRSFVAGWNGIVLPFDLTNDVKAALGASEVKTLSNASGDASSVTLTFDDASLPVAAGTPILVKLAAAASNVSFEGVDLKTSAITPVVQTAGGSTFTLTGTYASTNLASEEVYLVSNTKFYHKKAGDALTASPFRAYIVQTGNSPAHIGFDLEDGGTTGIVEINAIRNTMSESIYNVAGQRVAQPTKGLYIVNGKKVVLK